MKRRAGLLAILALAAAAMTAARASESDCFSTDNERRIAGCTALIESGIAIGPALSAAYAMRALAYSLKGRYGTAIRDYDRAIELQPTAAHSLDTRAHIRQVMGDPKGALTDYTAAMRFGGQEMTRLYQCGLTEAGLYKGRLDGIWRRELQAALEKCVVSTTCDPLPADEQCRPAVS